MSGKIVVAGSSNVDMICKLPSLPRPGETIGGGEFHRVNGGKGANQAVGAARAGGDVSFISCVGQDDFGKGCIDSFRTDGINTSHVKLAEGVATGIALIFVDEKGENSIAVAPGANYHLKPEDIEKATDTIAGADILLLQFEIEYETVLKAIDIAKKNNTRVLLNPAPAMEIDIETLSKLDYLVLNETETEVITGMKLENEADFQLAAEQLHNNGVETVIITLGAKGSYVSDGKEATLIPAFIVEAVDTTAAGDIYCGSLATALAAGKVLNEAVRFASAAAAISVTRLGAQPSAPTMAEIEKVL